MLAAAAAIGTGRGTHCFRWTNARIDGAPRAKRFADIVSTDHNILNEESESRLQHRYAVVAQDVFTNWTHSFASKTKTAQDTKKSLQRFLLPDQGPGTV